MSNLLRKHSLLREMSGVRIVQEVTRENSLLEYTALRVLEMGPKSVYEETLVDWEVCVVALTGKITVSDSEKTFANIGRRDNVFEKIPTDSVYISNDQTFTVTSNTDATIVLAYAPSSNKLPTVLIKAEDNKIEDRGKYSNKRHVHTILGDDSPIANSLLVVEVFTDSGNWSSYPPHKHDQDNLPDESFLEEIYYHEINPRQGFVFQRVYTDDRELDEVMAVENGDVVLVPKGYHPVAVPDGYDSYYLNIMAGPTKIWRFNNEKAHEWILNRD